MQSPYLPLPQTKIPLHTLRIHRLTSPSSFIIQVRCSLRIPSCVKERVWDITTTTKQFREKILHGCGRAWYCLGWLISHSQNFMYISEGFDNNLQHYFGCSRHLVDAHIPGVGGSALTSAIMYLFHLCNQTCNGMDLRAHRERESMMIAFCCGNFKLLIYISKTWCHQTNIDLLYLGSCVLCKEQLL
jgi:hypothetical protein